MKQCLRDFCSSCIYSPVISGTSKQVSQIPTIKQENNLESDNKQAGEESDEAKESEADPEISNCQHKSTSEPEVKLSKYPSISHLAKASQTEPLRRYSVDGADSANCPVHHAKADAGHHDSPIEEEGSLGGKGAPQEPRRRSNSASYSQVASS